MARYIPFAGRNAIAEASISIQFSAQFDATIAAAVDAIKKDFESEFPRFEPVQTLTLNFGPSAFPLPATTPAVAGFSLVKIKHDGTPGRIIRVIASSLSVHFLEYVSWKEAKPQTLDYITRCLQKLSLLERNPAASVMVRYVDRFTFDGPAEKATASELFRHNTKFLAPVILNSGARWHCNSGWIQPLIEESTALHNLNIQSGAPAAGDVIVDHASLFAFRKPHHSISDLMNGVDVQPPLGKILDKQHDANVEMLTNLLAQEMLDTIGLKG